MEKPELRTQFTEALDRLVKKLQADKKCLAAFLIGSVSHDQIWEWSDLQILLIYDDSYKGPADYHLLENDVPVVINIRKKSAFQDYLGSADVSDYFFCALSKSRLLFTKDLALQEDFEDLFYIGERDKEIEMLLGFAEAVYYLNKAEKNFRVKEDSDNALYFLYQVAQGIAWLEVARDRSFPEREIIAQASRLKPELFQQIYDPLFQEAMTAEKIDQMLTICHQYLEANTPEVYRPIIAYLEEHGTLREFSLRTREHGFGINYQWLYRMGIVERYVEPIRINNLDEEFFQIGYRLKA